MCPDRPRAALAILAALLTMVLPSAAGQLAAIAVAGLLGWWTLKIAQPGGGHAHSYPVSRKLGIVALLLFAAPLVGLPLWAAATDSSTIALLEGVYRSGALVFGGGHVVLPLLQASVVPSGVVSNADFLAGYGAAQAVPGPLFTSRPTSARSPTDRCMAGSAGWHSWARSSSPLFMLVGALPFWEGLRHRAGIQTAMAGINAGVVGILVSALYDPVWTSAIHSKADFGLALLSFGLLTVGRVPPALVVLLAGLVGWVMAMGV